MNITVENYVEEYPRFLEHLRACTFLSIDQEMTGVDAPPPPVESSDDDSESVANGEGGTGGERNKYAATSTSRARENARRHKSLAVQSHWTNPNAVDLDFSPEQVYRTKRQTAKLFLAFQFGITLFTAVEKTGDGAKEDGCDADRNALALEAHLASIASEKPGQRGTVEGACGTVFEVRPYNFYLRRSDGLMTLSGSAIQFLAGQGCNFQRWLTQGIPYCTRKEEAALREASQFRRDRQRDPMLWWRGSEEEQVVPRHMQYFVGRVGEFVREAIRSLILKAMDEIGKAEEEGEQTPPQETKVVSEPMGAKQVPFHEVSVSLKMGKKLSISEKKLLQNLYRDHPWLNFTFPFTSGAPLNVHGWNENNKKDHKKQDIEDCLNLKAEPRRKFWDSMVQSIRRIQAECGVPLSALSESVDALRETIEEDFTKRCDEEAEVALQKELGFRLYWKGILDAKKPIVGHNFLHDLMFMVQMHERNLPESYKGFKHDVSKLFPAGVWDSKVIASVLAGEATPFGKTSLEKVFLHCVGEEKRKMEGGSKRPQGTVGVVRELESEATALLDVAPNDLPGIVFPKEFDFYGGGDELKEEGGGKDFLSKPHVDPVSGILRVKEGHKPRSLQFLHEAAYDAFITGYVFRCLAGTASTSWREHRRPVSGSLRPSSTSLLQAYRNTVCGFGSAFFTRLTPFLLESPIQGPLSGVAHPCSDAVLPGKKEFGGVAPSFSMAEAVAACGDEFVHCFSFLIRTREVLHFDDIKDELIAILKKALIGRGEKNFSGIASRVFVMAMRSGFSNCSRVFYVACISGAVKTDILNALSRQRSSGDVVPVVGKGRGRGGTLQNKPHEAFFTLQKLSGCEIINY